MRRHGRDMATGAIGLTLLLLAGCASSSSDADTVGIGPARTEYKQSPCRRKTAWVRPQGGARPFQVQVAVSDSGEYGCTIRPQDAPPPASVWRQWLNGA